MPPLRSDKRDAILAEFDLLWGKREWPGVVELGKRHGVTRQWISLLLKAWRPQEYGKLKNPTRGRRVDLGR